jgi:Na+-translocating ferredoxin:NAD+ oxidoreductase RNF subunit RnfB
MSYSIIIYTVIMLSALGVVAAVILYFVAQKFKVFEDPRIDAVEAVLPGANCGGCGYPGCRGFADAFVKADDISVLFCPPGGNDTYKAAAKVLGKDAVAQDPLIAVVRCSGTPEHRKKTSTYDGATSCKVATTLYSGDTGCQYGCLGLGDCVVVCAFDAIYIDEITGLPVVSEEKCTACGACAKACPKFIIEMRRKGPKGKRIFVSCINKDKGAVAKKACNVACIGCNKCVKVCPHDAIVMENFLAYIDPVKCKLCRKCTVECPTGAILETNFPPRKVKAEGEEGNTDKVE